jgi:hypothetical protein
MKTASDSYHSDSRLNTLLHPIFSNHTCPLRLQEAWEQPWAAPLCLPAARRGRPCSKWSVNNGNINPSKMAHGWATGGPGDLTAIRRAPRAGGGLVTFWPQVWSSCELRQGVDMIALEAHEVRRVVKSARRPSRCVLTEKPGRA